jgi:hypothetical protein
LGNLRPALAADYTLVLPPGWLRLDARTEAGTQELDRELDRALHSVPADSYGPLICQDRKQAHTVLGLARAAGALDPYLPLGAMHSAPTPASFLVTMVHLHDTPPESANTQDPEARSMRIATMLAARMPAGEINPHASRRDQTDACRYRGPLPPREPRNRRLAVAGHSGGLPLAPALPVPQVGPGLLHHLVGSMAASTSATTWSFTTDNFPFKAYNDWRNSWPTKVKGDL